MARVNVYLPDDLANAARLAEVNVSAITQQALTRKLESLRFQTWLNDLAGLEAVNVAPDRVTAALDQGRQDFGE